MVEKSHPRKRSLAGVNLMRVVGKPRTGLKKKRPDLIEPGRPGHGVNMSGGRSPKAFQRPASWSVNRSDALLKRREVKCQRGGNGAEMLWIQSVTLGNCKAV